MNTHEINKQKNIRNSRDRYSFERFLLFGNSLVSAPETIQPGYLTKTKKAVRRTNLRETSRLRNIMPRGPEFEAWLVRSGLSHVSNMNVSRAGLYMDFT